jgi:hypothetical protein
VITHLSVTPEEGCNLQASVLLSKCSSQDTFVWRGCDALAAWLAAASLASGRVFRPVNKAGRVHSAGLTEKAVAMVLRQHAFASGLGRRRPP